MADVARARAFNRAPVLRVRWMRRPSALYVLLRRSLELQEAPANVCRPRENVPVEAVRGQVADALRQSWRSRASRTDARELGKAERTRSLGVASISSCDSMEKRKTHHSESG